MKLILRQVTFVTTDGEVWNVPAVSFGVAASIEEALLCVPFIGVEWDASVGEIDLPVAFKLLDQLVEKMMYLPNREFHVAFSQQQKVRRVLYSLKRFFQ